MSDEGTDVLLLTATDIETAVVLSTFAPGNEPRARQIGDRFYFDLGTLNGTRLMLTQCEMGPNGRGASQQALSKAIPLLKPAAVVMIGIAYGVNDEKQAIGDVLIAKQIMVYGLQRIGTDSEGKQTITPRGDKVSSSTNLLGLLRAAKPGWKGASLTFGTLLSGEKLVDNVDYREQLRQFASEAAGGEMEGEGVYVACAEAEAKVDWILVKAICDFADGMKHVDKDERQRIAATSAARFVRHALESVDVTWPGTSSTRQSGGRGGPGGNATVGGSGLAIGGRGGDGHTSNVFINHGQAGAMGPNAVAYGNSFQQQMSLQPLAGAEQAKWVDQIARLIAAMKLDAAEPEHYTALAEVKRAHLEAKMGDRNGTIAALGKAGRWAYEVAQKIGADAIVGLIKDTK